ncbi:MAG: hypothetical protein E6K53_01085 [Gammaproteobacteria bacterium]|nr:MAG: hypothetical protein E6K53_01085 [Gammaproteobacteria bacterium]
MKRSLQVTRSAAAVLLGVMLSATALAQTTDNKSSVAAARAQSRGPADKAPMPVAAVDIAAHLKSRVVTSVTVGAPEAAPAMAMQALKGVVAAR